LLVNENGNGKGADAVPAYKLRCGKGISIPFSSNAFSIFIYMLFFRVRKFSCIAHTEN
jgi:hypothetical protein